MNEMVIFLKINPVSLLIIVNLLDFLILNSKRIILLPIRNITDILKISMDYYIKQKDVRFLLITQEDEIEIEKNLFKANLLEISILHFRKIKTSRFLKIFFNNFESNQQNFKAKIYLN